MLDSSFIGSVEKDRETLLQEQKTLFQTANKSELEKKVLLLCLFVCCCYCLLLFLFYYYYCRYYKDKKKMRGRNKISAKLRRKQKNVVDAQLLKLKEKQKNAQELRDK